MSQTIILAPVYALLLLYALWVFFLAVMSLKRAKDAGLLTTTAKCFGYPVLFAGLLLDFLANTLVLTVLLLELPRGCRFLEWGSGTAGPAGRCAHCRVCRCPGGHHPAQCRARR